MKKLLAFGLLIWVTLTCHSQTTKDTCELKVRIVNNSKYYIDKLIIKKSFSESIAFDSLALRQVSEFKCTQSFYITMFQSDITFTKKRLIGKPLKIQIVSIPIDYHGEVVEQGLFELSLTIKRVRKESYKGDSEKSVKIKTYEVEFDNKQIDDTI